VNAVSKAREERATVLDLLPTGLWFGGLLALARTWLLAASPPGTVGDAVTLQRWATIQGFPAILAEALVAGVAGGLLLVIAANRGQMAMRMGGFVLALTVATIFLAGMPGTGGSAPVPGIGRDVAILASGTALVALMLAHTGNFVRGKLALATALLVAVGLPVLVARLLAADAPTMQRRIVIADIVASQDSWRIIEQRPGLPPKPVTLTPIVDAHADVADKPSIRMSPPCAVGFDVPIEAGACVLRAAAGADYPSVIDRLPKDLAALTIDYSVEVDGVVVWSERVAHAPMPDGRWEPERFAWRHAGGADGIPLAPGQRVVLRTAFAPGQDLAQLDTERGLELGFGGVVLERKATLARTLARPDAPNIVFIVMDTQRVDRLGCHGYRRHVSPNIDALAERGTLFEDAYATSSWTWPSTASLLTGMLPDEHGVTENAHCTLSHSLVTLAEVLQARGYTTAAVSGNPLIVERRQFDQGFEHFDGSVPHFRMSDEIVPGALRWLREHAGARFFLYLHLVDPHTPHRPHPEEALRLRLGAPPPGWPEHGADGIPVHPESMGYEVTPAVQQYMSDEYDASVATGDRWVGAVLDELAQLGLNDRTLVCFTSDHGEGLLDHGLRGHGNSVFAEEVRVPLIFAGPGIPVGKRVPGAVSNRHVAPTLAAYGGTELGVRDPLHLIDDELPEAAPTTTRRGRVAKERGLVLHGFRAGDWTLHWNERPLETGMLAPLDVVVSDLWLFDVAVDPTERTNLVILEETRARGLLERLQATLADVRRHAPSIVPGVGAGGLHTLRTIGYVGDD
jgi:arylsulfatase A-like enzyme